MSAHDTTLSPVTLPGTVSILSRRHGSSAKVYRIAETEPHTDRALLAYCGADDYLGGRVERIGLPAGQADVHVYID